jgi:hypothetical protein
MKKVILFMFAASMLVTSCSHTICGFKTEVCGKVGCKNVSSCLVITEKGVLLKVAR